MNTIWKGLAGAALALGLTAPLPAAVTVSVDMDPATPGIQGSRVVAAGQNITVDLVMTVGAEGVSSYGISAQFDTAELGLNGSPAATVPPLPGGLSALAPPIENNALGRVYSVNGATLGIGPASTSFVIGSINFTVAAPVSDGAADVSLGIFNFGIDGCFDNAGNAVVPVFVNGGVDSAPKATTTTVASSINPSTDGQAVTFTATVSASGGGTPTGTVTFLDNGVAMPGGSTVVVIGGAAVFSTSTLPVGSHPITAAYSGDASFAPGTSASLTQVVNEDRTPPTCVSATALFSLTNVVVRFNELVFAGEAENELNYEVPGFIVEDAVLNADGMSVTLSVDAPFTPGTSYQVVIQGVEDLAGNVVSPNPCILTFRTPVYSCGFAFQELYQNIGGGVIVSDLTSHPSFPNSPTTQAYVGFLEGPLNAFDNYGTRITGVLIPPVSGNYNFFMSSDEQGEFSLSTDSSPANLGQICFEPSWSNAREWTGGGGGGGRNAAAPENQSSTFFPGGIPLTAGQFYFFELLAKEGAGGDNCGVAWQIPGAPLPANGSSPISGAFMAALADPTGASINITQQPVDQVYLISADTLLSESFNSGNGGFTVETPQAFNTPWTYNAGAGTWEVNQDGAEVNHAMTTFLTSPELTATNTGPLTVSLDHRWSVEGPDWDGCQLQISINGGPFVVVNDFSQNGYNGAVRADSRSIHAGQRCWAVDSPIFAGGFVTSVGTTPAVAAGDRVRIRFAYAGDTNTRGNNLPSWQIDHVQVKQSGLQPGVSFSVMTTANRSPVFYQWYCDNGSGFSPLSGANDPTLTFTPTLAQNGNRYRCAAYIPGAVVTSAAAILTVLESEPVIHCPGNVMAECTGGLTPVTYTVTATDLSGPLPVTCLPPSGTGFRLGTSNVVCTVPNSTVSCSFTVTVVDTTPPRVTCPSDITVQAPSPAGAVVTYSASAADACGIADFGCTPPSGSTYPIGMTTVTCTVVDGARNTNSCSFTVNVVAPNRCPVASNLNVSADQDSQVNFQLPATDEDGDALNYSITQPPAHGIVSVNILTGAASYTPARGYCGPDSIRFRVSDGQCDSAESTVSISVRCIPPVMDCPSNVTAECTGGLTPVTFSVTASNVLGPVPVTCVPPSGTGFRLGTSNVVCMATSGSSSATCSFSLTVVDTVPPRVTCPGAITALTTNAAGAVVSYVASAADACGIADFRCSPASGTVFPIGKSVVICTASDVSGNSNSCQFHVIVLGARGIKEDCLAQLATLRAGVTNRHDGDELDDAIEHLTRSLDSALWLDQTHLPRKGGDKVFEEEKKAVHELVELLQDRRSTVADADLHALIDCILRADRMLAVTAVDEAEAAGVKPKKIAEDRKEIEKGDDDAAKGKYEEAVEHYRNAWKHAVHIKIDPPHRLATGGAHLTFLGIERETYVIQASADLIHWISIGTATANADGEVALDDPVASGMGLRFYRVVAP